MTAGAGPLKVFCHLGLPTTSKGPNVHHVFSFLQVRTLFVSGLPVDIKPRELYLLFRPFKVSVIVHPERAMRFSRTVYTCVR